ncbi:hypothetical protein KSP40_PGU003173 [Platanthera guangdongensis]|uniref:Uncharacterized protein n=1 Tax=Platanthera guangdongensis TaxID=2320717 RepID=A0ABR2M1D9_9ASPA
MVVLGSSAAILCDRSFSYSYSSYMKSNVLSLEVLFGDDLNVDDNEIDVYEEIIVADETRATDNVNDGPEQVNCLHPAPRHPEEASPRNPEHPHLPTLWWMRPR